MLLDGTREGWPSLLAPVRVSRPSGHGAMRLVHTAPDLVELRGRRSVRGPLLVGGVLLFGPALATLLASPPLTTSRLVVTAIIAVSAAGLIALGWPTLRRVRLDPRRRTVQVGDAAPEELGVDPWLQLGAAPAQAPTGPARYAVTLERRDAGPLLLLASESPAVALRELAALREALPLPVVAGWGLPAAGPPWVDRIRSAGPDEQPTPVGDDLVSTAAKRRAATTLLVGAAAIACGLALQVSERVARGDPPNPVSIALPILGIVALTAVAIAVGTEGVRLGVASDLVCEHRIWGLTVSRHAVARTAIRHAYLVGPHGAEVRHLLLDTTGGPIAFPCAADDGQRLVASLARDDA